MPSPDTWPTTLPFGLMSTRVGQLCAVYARQILEVSIIDYGMGYPISENGLPDVAGIFLVGELGRMDADHNQLICVFRFEALELRNNVHAVDTAIGPEVEQNNLSAQVPD